MKSLKFAVLLVATWCVSLVALAGSEPVVARHGMVVSVSAIASDVGAQVLRDGGNAMDAAVATAFALAVTHPSAGNIGGGGFLVYRSASGEAVSYDFRETAPAAASPTMFLKDGVYDYKLHHLGHGAVGVPGTVAGLHLAWQERGKLPWKRLLAPAISLARNGFPLSSSLASELRGQLERMKPYPASVAQFSNRGRPYQAGETFKQPDLARTLQRIAVRGPADFYEGETARLIDREMRAHGGLITLDDLKAYRPRVTTPVKGSYRGFDIIGMPPPSSGGTTIIEILNLLEGYDLQSLGFGSAEALHLIAESMRRGFADRAQYLGDPAFNPQMPIDRLISKDYARELRKTIDPDHASKSSPTSFSWTHESDQTTHFSVVDAERNAVALTYTLEYSYGSHIVVPGGGFLLNNEMGDFNAGPGLTGADGSIGTAPNLAAPGKRMLSSMSPTILTRDGKLFMVTGSPGGRTIINTTLLTILNVVDFGMNAQEAVDAGRIHHQWLPDRLAYEKYGFSPDTLRVLRAKGHVLKEVGGQGAAEVILYDAAKDLLEGGVDRRQVDAGAGLYQ